jgi:hypothetical protein
MDMMLAQYLDNLEPRRPAKWAFLEAHLPGLSPTRVGVLLLEPCRDRLHIRIKPYWWNDLVDGEEGQIWEGLSEDLRVKAEQMGATIFLNWLEDCCSHSLQIGATQAIKMRQPETCVNRLYGEHVDQSAICSVVHKASASGTLSPMPVRPPEALFTRTRRAVSRKYRWTAQAALAASMLFGAWIAGYHSSHDIDAQQNITSVSKAIELPLVSEFHYQNVQLNLSSAWQPSRRRPRRRKTHVSARVARPFVLAHRLVKRQDVQVAMIQPPLLPANYTPACESIPTHLLPEPGFPEFHPRHNRFLRILAAVTIPFRFIAKSGA